MRLKKSNCRENRVSHLNKKNMDFKLYMSILLCILTYFMSLVSLLPPENIIKPLVFLCFRRWFKETGDKWVKRVLLLHIRLKDPQNRGLRRCGNLKKFAKFMEKPLRWSPCFNKVVDWDLQFYYKMNPSQDFFLWFLWIFSEAFQNTVKDLRCSFLWKIVHGKYVKV